MAWEDKPWDQRLFELTELSDDEKGKLHALIMALPLPEHWEVAVPKVRTAAVASLRKRLALAEAGRSAHEAPPGTKRQFRVWKNTASKKKYTFWAPGNIALDALKDLIATEFTYHQKVEFTLVEPTLKRDVDEEWLEVLLQLIPPGQVVELMIRSEEVAFSAKGPGGNDAEGRRAQLEALLNVSAVDGIPELKAGEVGMLSLDDTAAINLGRGGENESVKFQDLLESITTTLKLRTDATMESLTAEVDDRAYIDPILVGATLVAASTSTGAGSSSSTSGDFQARQRDLRLVAEKLLIGHKTVGKVDWVFMYRTLAVIVAEAKHADLNQAWVQLYRQIAAMLDELARAAADITQRKKRTRWQAFTLPEMQAIAVLCTSKEWQVVKYTPPRSNKPGSICRGAAMQLTLGLSVSKGELQAQVRKLVLTLAWVLRQQMDALDDAIAAHPKLETVAEHSAADAEGAMFAEIRANLEKTGEEGALDDQDTVQEE